MRQEHAALPLPLWQARGGVELGGRLLAQEPDRLHVGKLLRSTLPRLVTRGQKIPGLENSGS